LCNDTDKDVTKNILTKFWIQYNPDHQKRSGIYSKISNRKYYSSQKWVCKIEQKIKWKKFQFKLLLNKLAQPKHMSSGWKMEFNQFSTLFLMIKSITSITASHPVQFMKTSPNSVNQASQSVLRVLLPSLNQSSP
jgi:hypothetical protein